MMHLPRLSHIGIFSPLFIQWFRLHARVILPGVVCALLCAAAAAQETGLDQSISMDAESAELDRKTSMQVYHGLRLTQGDISVRADLGRGSNLDFQDSAWHLSGNVIIDVKNGHVECDTADLRFEDNRLQSARIAGAPATFELRRPDSDVVTYAQAKNLVYDFADSIVEFSGDAVITEGGNSIASDYLVYNIAEQRIKASGGEGKVRVRYTPAEDAAGQDEPEAAEPPDEPQNDTDGP